MYVLSQEAGIILLHQHSIILHDMKLTIVTSYSTADVS